MKLLCATPLDFASSTRQLSRAARRSLQASAALVALAVVTHAQHPIGAERPGITIPPAVMDPNRFQVEFGWPTVAYARGSGVHTELWSFPVQMRYGMTRTTELRLFSPTWSHLNDGSSAGSDIEGFGDVEIGTKTLLADGDGSMPKAAVVTAVHLPVGENSFTTHQPGYSLNLAAQWSLSYSTGLTALLGVTRTPVGSDDATTGAVAASYGMAIDERWGTYLEAGWYPNIHNSVDTAVAGTGVTCLLDDNTQLDVFGDFGLNSDTPDAVLGIGLSLRF